MPLTLRTLILPLMLLIATSCSPEQTTIEADYVIENVNVVPLNEEIILPNKAVAVRDDKIVAIVNQSSAGNITGKHIDGAGLYLMPGLTDMHIHMRTDPQAAFNLFLANGVTTVTNMGLADGRGKIDHLQLRSDVAAGNMVGPRYLVSGPQLNPENLTTLDGVMAALDRHVDQGFDVLKVHGDLEFDVYDALMTGARERGLRVTGHSQHQMPLSQSLRMDSIEHLEEFLYVKRDGAGIKVTGDFMAIINTYYDHVDQLANPDYRGPVIQDMAASGIYFDATLIIYKMIYNWVDDDIFAAMRDDELLAYLPASTVDYWLNTETNEYRRDAFPLSAEHLKSNVELLSTILFELNEAGVPLLLGTDSFGTLVPGFSVHKELALMTEAGLTPYEALRTGTVNVAAYLGESDHAGTVEVGKRADLILVEGNPLRDVGNAANVRGVYTQGKWHSKSDLAAMLNDAKDLVADWK